MKKVIKRFFIILILFVIVFEFPFSNITYAASSTEIDENTINAIANLAGGIVSVILWIPRIIATLAALGINKLFMAIAEAKDSIDIPSGYGSEFKFLTPFSIFFDEFSILGVNFFNINESPNPESVVYKFRHTVAYWFYAMRLISSAILLVILIYVGIRMAISTIAEDKAKYKKMLWDWFCSLALIFILQYIAIGIIYINDALVHALKASVNSGAMTGIDEMMTDIGLNASFGVGITSMISTIVFCAITAQSVFFFIAYLNRVIKVGFLIIISPLISITYSIDKIGDGKAQALNTWLKEFAYTILIQPFHCIIYISLINTAFNLMKNATFITTGGIGGIDGMNKLANGVLVILCLKFVNDAEKIVRTIFGFDDENSKTSFAAGTIMAGAMLANAKKYGGYTRKTLNVIGRYPRGLVDSIGKDKANIAKKFAEKNPNTGKLLDKISDTKKNVTGGMDKIKNRVASNPLLSGIGNTAGKIGNNARKISGFYKGLKEKYKGSKLQAFNRRQTAIALGMMGMAMSYSTGNTTLLAANAYRQGIQDGTNEFFASSTDTMAGQQRDNMAKVDTAEYDQLNDELDSTKKNINDLRFDSNISSEDANNIVNSKAASDAAENAKKAEEARQNAEKAYKKAIQERENAEAKAKAMSQTRKAQKVADAEIEAKKQAEEQAEKELKDATNNADLANQEAERYSELTKLVNKRDRLQKQKDKFYTDEAIRERVARRVYGPSLSDLENKKNEILKLIMDLQKIRRNKAEGDTTQTNLLDEDDTDNAVKIRDDIVKEIDLSIFRGGASVKTSNVLKSRMGLDERASDTLDSIDKAVKDYEMIQRNISISNTFKSGASIGVNEDFLIDKMANDLKNSRRNS